MYNKFGEMDWIWKLNVLIIGVIIENLEFLFLKMFMCCILIIIMLLSLEECMVFECVEFLKYLFFSEVYWVNKLICIEDEVVKVLIGNIIYGNIG